MVCRLRHIFIVFLAPACASTLRFAESETATRKSQKGRYLRHRVSKETTEAHLHGEIEGEGRAAADDIVELTADANVPKLDMTLQNLPPAPYVLVDQVLKGSWADDAGIKKGWEILKVNGRDANAMTQQDFVADMKARPVTISFKKADPNLAGGSLQDSLKKTLNEAVKSGRVAGAQAGKEMAKQLIDDLKKVLSSTPGPTVAQAGAPGAAVNAPPQGVLPPGGVPPPFGMPGAGLAPFAPAAAPPWQRITPSYKAVDAASEKPCKDKEGPPNPVPPSPLDALKAAMAIRANVSATDSPILSPDVLDAVARLAKGRLGAFVPPGAAPSAPPAGLPAAVAAGLPAAVASGLPIPFAGAGPAAPVQCTPQPCPQPQAPPPAPAAPQVSDEKIEFEVTIKHISFTALSASPKLYNNAVAIVKETISQAAGGGVKESDVTVTLKAGSVIVHAVVATPLGADAASISKNLERSAEAITARLIEKMSALPAIQSVALGNITASAPAVQVVKDAMTTTTTTTPYVLRTLPKPPACAAAPPKLTKSDIAMSLAPFKPAGARGKGVKMSDGGSAWPLDDGGWAFQYPDMAVRMTQDGSTRIVWAKPAYAVEYDDSGISYHVGRNVVHRDTNGDLTYQQPTGTMHQEGSTLVYHWCNPNVIVYQTPNGFVYYDDLGMTYRSMGKDVTHYTWNGEVLYQGAGGVTRQESDGTVTHWTDAGAVFRHRDGSVSYTPTGESASQPLTMGDLGPDPFPGPELSAQDVMKISLPSPLALGPVPAPAAMAAPAPGVSAVTPSLIPFGTR